MKDWLILFKSIFYAILVWLLSLYCSLIATQWYEVVITLFLQIVTSGAIYMNYRRELDEYYTGSK